MKINKSNKKCKTESSSQNTLFCFWKWWLVVSQQTEASQSAVFARRSWLWALSSQLASLHPSALQCSSPLLQVPSTALHQVPYPHYCTVPSTMGPVLHCTGYPVPSAQYCIVPSTMGPVLHCTQYLVPSTALYPVPWAQYCTVPSTMGPVLHCTQYLVPSTALYPVPWAQYCTAPSTMSSVLHCTQCTDFSAYTERALDCTKLK